MTILGGNQPGFCLSDKKQDKILKRNQLSGIPLLNMEYLLNDFTLPYSAVHFKHFAKISLSFIQRSLQCSNLQLSKNYIQKYPFFNCQFLGKKRIYCKLQKCYNWCVTAPRLVTERGGLKYGVVNLCNGCRHSRRDLSRYL